MYSENRQHGYVEQGGRWHLGFSWWWWQRDYLLRTGAGQGRERGLDFPSNVELQGVSLVPLRAKAEPGPWM